MIINGLLYALYAVVYLFLAPLRIFSDVILPTDIHNSIQTARTYLANINIVIPVATIAAIFGIMLAIEGFVLLYKAVNWLIRKIPTIN